jgi:hypothetical protein
MVVAAVALVVSLFLVWSHQLSASLIARYGSTGVFDGVPRAPDAWQVYTAADVLLTLVAVGLLAAALLGDRTLRLVLLAVVAIGLAFVVHAIGTPPTNGADIFDPHTGHYVATGAGSGSGEVVALVALALAATALIVSLASDP